MSEPARQKKESIVTKPSFNATYKRTTQTIVYLPHFISSVIIAGIVITAFSPTAGIVNTILGWFGLDSIYFLTLPEWFRPIFVGTGIWQASAPSSSSLPSQASIHHCTKARWSMAPTAGK